MAGVSIFALTRKLASDLFFDHWFVGNFSDSSVLLDISCQVLERICLRSVWWSLSFDG